MSSIKNVKLEKYIPVRKLKKLENQALVLQKQQLVTASNDEVKTLPNVA
ncbi:MAG: hypothetical protein R3E62_05690 [Pseudomonadales bacterium]|jgi:hypothetical protein